MSSGWAHNGHVRVLVVEDHVALANRIGEGLRDAGFAVDVVYDGMAALESTASTGYNVIVLDRDLPAVHGDRVCRRPVRDGSPSRIVMLTAATDVEDRVDGLEPGSSATHRASRPLNDRISPVACTVTWSKAPRPAS
jgi:DNA-binding response OmpR family regulator